MKLKRLLNTFLSGSVEFFQVSQLVDWLPTSSLTRKKKCTKCLSHSGLTENCQRQLQHSATKLVLLAQREIMSRTISGDTFGQMTTTTTHFHADSQNKNGFPSLALTLEFLVSVNSYGIFWILLESFRFFWNLFNSFGIFSILLESFGISWILLESFEILWNLLESYGFF